MYRIIVYFASFEILGFLGFIVSSRYQEGMVTRTLPLLLALVTVAFIAYLKAEEFSYREIAYISVVASAILVLVVHILGFTVYPGLAKDMDFLSGENLVRAGVMLSIGTAGHFLLLSLVRVVRM